MPLKTRPFSLTNLMRGQEREGEQGNKGSGSGARKKRLSTGETERERDLSGVGRAKCDDGWGLKEEGDGRRRRQRGKRSAREGGLERNNSVIRDIVLNASVAVNGSREHEAGAAIVRSVREREAIDVSVNAREDRRLLERSSLTAQLTRE